MSPHSPVASIDPDPLSPLSDASGAVVSRTVRFPVGGGTVDPLVGGAYADGRERRSFAGSTAHRGHLQSRWQWPLRAFLGTVYWICFSGMQTASAMRCCCLR